MAVTAIAASLLIAAAPAQAATAAAAPAQSAPLAAAAISPGTIKGVISQSKAGATTPLEGAWIALYRVDGTTRTWADSASADASGRYSLTGVAAGTYTLEVQAPYDSDLASQWLGDKPSLASAVTFTVASGKTLAQNVTLKTGGKITGTVKVPSGYAAGSVSLWITDSLGQWVSGARTSTSGNYTIKGLRSGSYKIQFNDYGSPTSTYEPLASEWWDNQQTEATATPITVKAGATASGTNAVLEVGGRLSGVVTQTVSGVVTPVGQLKVSALSSTGAELVSVWTSGDGTYEMYGLKAGSYKLRASGNPWVPEHAAFADLYWPSSSTLAAGSTATVVSKKTKTGVNFQFDSTPRVTLSTPVVSGTPKVGATLKASTKISPTSATLKYQWYASGAAISGATKSSLVLASAQAGKTITVKVSGTKASYTSATATSKATLKVVKSAVPTISGTAKVGATLTAKSGTWMTGVKFVYQWYANGAAISGAKASTFVVTSTQAGKAITVAVAGSLSGYASVTEKSTTSIKPALTAVPTITGTPKVGATLTAKPGTWTTGTSLAYQWYASGSAVSGATKSTLALTSAHAGKVLTVKVTGKLTGYTTFTETSKATVKVLKTAVPTISGTAKVGATLTAKPGTWTTGVKFAYQWYANGTAISGAKASTFVVPSTQAGKAITVAVTGSLSGYASVTEKSTTSVKPARAAVSTKAVQATTEATQSVAPEAPNARADDEVAEPLNAVQSAVPTITGEARVGGVLELEPGVWTPGVSTFTYQWYADGTAIPDATASTFLVTAEHAGQAITVGMTSAQDGYVAVTEQSAALNVALTSVPTIRAEGEGNVTVSVDPGEWTAGTTFSYRWFADDVEIEDATGSRLQLDSETDHSVLTVEVTGAHAGFTTFVVMSAPGGPF